MPDDARDLADLFRKHAVEYVIVGGQAVIFHGYPRFTGDTDFFIRSEHENVLRVYEALKEFWGGIIPGVARPDDLLEGMGVQFGVYPYRIDILRDIGMEFDRVWKTKVTAPIGGVTSFIIGLPELIEAKMIAGRAQDLADAEMLKKKI